jgi:hypothetical protein
MRLGSPTPPTHELARTTLSQRTLFNASRRDVPSATSATERTTARPHQPFLVDHVLPDATSVRQWVLPLPYSIRLVCAHDPVALAAARVIRAEA